MIMPYFFWAPVFSQYDQLNKDLSYDNRRTDIIHYLQKIINELIINNNNLPDYIQQEINKMSSGIDGKVAALEQFYKWAEDTYDEELAQYQLLSNEYTTKWVNDILFQQFGTIQRAINDQKAEIVQTRTNLDNKIHYTIGG